MELISVFNLDTGKVGTIRRDWFEHPVINPGILVEAEPGQKSYAPELYKSRLEQDDETDSTNDDETSGEDE